MLIDILGNSCDATLSDIITPFKRSDVISKEELCNCGISRGWVLLSEEKQNEGFLRPLPLMYCGLWKNFLMYCEHSITHVYQHPYLY